MKSTWCKLFPSYLLVLVISQFSTACDTPFDGFGIHLGSIGDFVHSTPDKIQNVIDTLYFDLKLRHFRTSYEPYFSTSPGLYNINCTTNDSLMHTNQISSSNNCNWSWNSALEIISNRSHYPEPIHIFASIWSPPYYMKDVELSKLLPSHEQDYYYYIKNITALIKSQYGLDIERVSPVNEPDNIFAPWDHCNMNAAQLCSMVSKFNDSLISLCPENSYFWLTQLWTNYHYSPGIVNCSSACSVIATHAYALNINSSSPNLFKAYYDLIPYNVSILPNKVIWQTEVSSTYSYAQDHQMEEALDFATNLIHFVGYTCVQRYYFWSAWSGGPSGESLIWGDEYPKKYWVYNHFTNASYEVGSNLKGRNESLIVNVCEPVDFVNHDDDGNEDDHRLCLKFDEIHTIFVNRVDSIQIINDSLINCNCGLCCTTHEHDLSCDFNKYILPPLSVCTCKGGNCI